jgi:hypothetical protein
MLSRLISKNLTYTGVFSRTSVRFSSVYNFNYKNFAKKDKGRLSDSDSKRGAKASSTDNSETMDFTKSTDSIHNTTDPKSVTNTDIADSEDYTFSKDSLHESPVASHSSNSKEIQTVEGHKVIIIFILIASYARRINCWKICRYIIYCSQ